MEPENCHKIFVEPQNHHKKISGAKKLPGKILELIPVKILENPDDSIENERKPKIAKEKKNNDECVDSFDIHYTIF